MLGQERWGRTLSVNPALYFHMDPIQTTELPFPPPKPSPAPSVPGYIWPFRRGSQDGNQTFRMSGCFRTLTLSVCLSFSFLSTPYWKHNFPLSLSSPPLLGNRGSLFIPWAMAWKCPQLGMWDAGQAGTNHRKKAWVGDWHAAEIDIQ